MTEEYYTALRILQEVVMSSEDELLQELNDYPDLAALLKGVYETLLSDLPQDRAGMIAVSITAAFRLGLETVKV